MSDKKYPGRNESDTFFDNHHRRFGQMTNREFFSSNAKGGFYEGMEWDGEEWVPDQKSRDRQAEIDSRKCSECELDPCRCW